MLRFRNSLTGVIALTRKTRWVHTRDSDAFNRFPHCQDWTDGIKEYGAELFQTLRNDMKHDLNSLQKFQDEVGEKVREVRTGTSDQVAKKVTKEVWKAWLLTNPAELVGRQIDCTLGDHTARAIRS